MAALVVATVLFFASLWVFRFFAWSWLPTGVSDRWVVAAGFATLMGTSVFLTLEAWVKGERRKTGGAGDGASPLTGSGDRIEVRGTFHAPVVVKGSQANDVAGRQGSGARVVMLPPGPVRLVGRGTEVERALEFLRPGVGRAGGGVMVVSAVAGLAGVGKSALVLHVAHEAVRRGWFEGGALFVDLRGYDERVRVDAGAVVGMWLRALGVPDDEVPPTADEQAGRLRSVLARLAGQGRRVLLVADNASDADQVLGLVPAQGEHRLLVTSRDWLALPAELVDLDQLDPGAAEQLVAGVLTRARPGDLRAEQEVEALSELARWCGGLPLALEIMAQVLVADPGLRIDEAVAQLRGELDGVAVPGGGGRLVRVRAAFDLSYRRLPSEAAGLFRLLALNPGPEATTEAAGVLAELPVGAARRVLAGLAEAGLLREVPAGSGRWRMHDLLRVYARELAGSEDASDVSREAQRRLLEYYTVGADAADDHLRALSGAVVPERFQDRAGALAWLGVHRTALLEAVGAAVSAERDDLVGLLAASLAMYLVEYVRRFDEAIAVGQIAVWAARVSGDRRGEGGALNNLGLALREVRRFGEAIDAHNAGLAICRELGDRRGEGGALNNLGLAFQEVRRFGEAIDAHQQAATIYDELGDRHREGTAMNNLRVARQAAHRGLFSGWVRRPKPVPDAP
jgi:tetratricopeptide (TPR) repeat protein